MVPPGGVEPPTQGFSVPNQSPPRFLLILKVLAFNSILSPNGLLFCHPQNNREKSCYQDFFINFLDRKEISSDDRRRRLLYVSIDIIEVKMVGYIS